MKKIFFIQIIFFLHLSNCYPQTGWVICSSGTNRGIFDIYFVNTNTGWAVGDSVIMKSTNGGVNWVGQNFSYTSRPALYSVRFLNENTGYAAGGNTTGQYSFIQYIFKTTNGGINWNLIFESTYLGAINKILPLDNNTIFISLSGVIEINSVGGLYKSTNGGLNFSLSLSKGLHNSVFFNNLYTGWTTSYLFADFGPRKGFIYKTTDGGSSWNMQFRDSSGGAADIRTIQFVNNNTGFAIGSKNGTIFFKTTNGGNNWDTILYNHTKNSSLFFLDQNTGWISGGCSPDTFSIAITTNGGLNWTKQFKNGLYTVNNLELINSLTGWATMSNSCMILKTTNGGVTFMSNISSEIPDSYSLFQNYPNPFNPNTNIKYQIINNKFVSIKIFDILGKEVATLINEKQSPGTYEVSFDGSNLPSGIYFYKLETDGFSDTKRMILLK